MYLYTSKWLGKLTYHAKSIYYYIQKSLFLKLYFRAELSAGVLSSAKDAACDAFTNVTTEVGMFLLLVICKMHFCKYKKKQY